MARRFCTCINFQYEVNHAFPFPAAAAAADSPQYSQSCRPGHEEIILVRHGQSQGNVDEHGANPKVRLTEQGITESVLAGVNILRMIEEDGTDDWKAHFYVSPYQRAIERLRDLAEAFDKSRIAGVREETRLREQDWALKFPGTRTEQMEKAARNLYRRFFYRFPDGESAADVYDRILESNSAA